MRAVSPVSAPGARRAGGAAAGRPGHGGERADVEPSGLAAAATGAGPCPGPCPGPCRAPSAPEPRGRAGSAAAWPRAPQQGHGGALEPRRGWESAPASLREFSIASPGAGTGAARAELPRGLSPAAERDQRSQPREVLWENGSSSSRVSALAISWESSVTAGTAGPCWARAAGGLGVRLPGLCFETEPFPSPSGREHEIPHVATSRALIGFGVNSSFG